MKSSFEYNQLFSVLKPHLRIHKARLVCICLLITSLLKVRSVNFNRLSEGIFTGASLDSNLRRIQRFFAKFRFEQEAFSGLLLAMMPIKGKFKLSLDRTNWKFGKRNINILFLSVIYQGVGLPILWTILGDKKGNSNQQERIDLMNRFFCLFGEDKIEYLTADREFIGGKWWSYLSENQIPFYIRVRENMFLTTADGKQIKSKWLLQSQPLYQAYFHPKIVYINGVLVYFSGMKTVVKGKVEYLAIASFHQQDLSFECYKQRWQIETMFKAFKSSGFNLEDTHLRDYKRINNLLCIISISFIWAYSTGIYYHENEKPIRIKTHKRREKSLFSYGLEKLRHALVNKIEVEIIKLCSLVLSCT